MTDAGLEGLKGTFENLKLQLISDDGTIVRRRSLRTCSAVVDIYIVIIVVVVEVCNRRNLQSLELIKLCQ